MARSLLVAYDGSEPANRALETAITAFVDPNITVMHVLDPSDLIGSVGGEGAVVNNFQRRQEERHSEADRLLSEARQRAEEHGVDVRTTIESGSTARTIVEYAEDHDIDHIAIGSHGRTGVERFLLGSVAETVVRRAPVPVTVVR